MNENLKRALREIENHLANGIIPFWVGNGFDEEFGGFLTCFDSDGKRTSDTNKYIVTQTRMIWGLSALYAEYPENEELIKMAKKGVDFFIEHFWDKENLGWFWKVSRDGTLIDDGKVVYGQSFAIYALAQYAKVTGDEIALNYAEKTFDLLQKYCTDTLRGGYYENLENDWSISESGFAAGDRKSLDIHMHLMEAFTVLANVTQKEIHRRKLDEVMDLILNKMVNHKYGCGLNQFDLNFNPIPAIDIRRTWNAERATGETIETPTDTTSYGHNVELAWLLNYASDILGRPFDYYNEIVKKLTDHSLKYGFDYEFGGIYRDGAHDGEALVYDKEFWQNSECLVGYLNAYERLGDSKYLEAFYKTWQFDSKYFINHEHGEWRQLLTREGCPIVSDLGNPWKAIYHSGRSLLESKRRLTSLLTIR
jgi:mannobiose 2-epimerase